MGNPVRMSDSDGLALGLSIPPSTKPVTPGGAFPILRQAVGWYDAQNESTVEANGALTFTASDNQYLEIDQCPVTAYPITIACWFKTTQAGAIGTFCQIGDKDSGVDHLFVATWFGAVRIGARNITTNDTSVQAGSGTNDGNWHLAVAVFESSTSRILYVDDESPATSTTEVTIDATFDRVSLGRQGDSTPTNHYDGSLAQPAIWNVALSAAQVSALYNAGVMVPFEDVLQPTAHWWLNDRVIRKWGDTAGTLDLTGAGGTGFPALTTGLRNEAGVFVAANQHRLEIDTAAATAYPFSVSLWFKTGTAATSQVLFFLGDKNSDLDYHIVWIDSSDDVSATSRSTADGVHASTLAGSFADDSWHHVLAVFTSATSRQVFVDGTAATENTGSVTIGAAPDRTSIGRLGRSNATQYHDGEVDEAMFFTSALTSENATELYNGGTPLSLQEITNTIGKPSNYWSMDKPSKFIDSAGTLDLDAFGDSTSPTPTKGPNAVPAAQFSSVSQWNSSSVNANNVAQATRTRQPQYVQVPWADGFRWALRFDGVDDSLGTSFAGIAQPFQTFSVARYLVNLVVSEQFIWGSANHPSVRELSGDMVIHPGSSSSSGAPSTLNQELYNAIVNGASSQLRRAEVDTATGMSGNLDSSSLYLASRSASLVGVANVNIFAHVIFDSPLSTADDEKITAYYRSEYLINWGDPADANSYQGPAGWWSAQSIGNKTANDGTGNDVQDGDRVGYHADCSGNNNNPTSVTAKPTFIESVSQLNGKSALLYAEASERLNIPAPLAVSVPGFTIILVSLQSQKTNTQRNAFFISNGLSNDSTRIVLNLTPTNVWRAAGRRLDDDPFDSITSAGKEHSTIGEITMAVFDYQGTRLDLYVGGGTAFTNSSFQTAGLSDSTNPIGQTLGNNSPGAATFGDHIAQCQVFERALTTIELNRIGQHLANFYGLAWTNIS